jgi:ribosomal protein S9
LQDYKIDKENRLVLKPFGFLTRDSRIKERKKYGLRKAKSSQFQNVKLLYLFTEREYAKI